MINTSKILTVSYGTFSCTLEGFDDSFNTMKAIAEYFRDLASDDRYFGAEPPTPDAEMLARIAEREIERRVEAYMDKGNIVLRTGADKAAVAAPGPEPVPAEAQEAAAPQAEEVQTPEAAPVEATPEIAPEIAEEAIAEEEVAEEAVEEVRAAEVETAEIEAAAAPEAEAEAQTEAEVQAEAAVETEVEVEAPAETVAEEHAEEAARDEDTAAEQITGEDIAAEADITEAEAEAPAVAAEQTEAPVEAPVDAHAKEPQAEAELPREDTAKTPEADQNDAQEDEALTLASIAARVAKPAPADTAATAEAPAPHTPVSHPDQNSVAAKLQRIRAVVSKTEAEAEGEAAYIEDQHAEAEIAQSAEEDAPAATEKADDVSSILARLSRERQAEAEAAQEAPAADAQAQAQAQAQIEDEELEQADRAEEPAPAAGTFADLADALIAEDDAEREDERAALADDDNEDDDDEAYIEVEEIDLPEGESAEGDGPQTQPLRARVIRMKRSEFDAALAAGQIEEAFDDEDDTDFETAAELDLPAEAAVADEGADDEASSLSAAEEAELQRELAAVEADLDDAWETEEAQIVDEDPQAHAEDEAAQAEASPDQPSGALRLRESEPDLNRMLEKAETQMDEPDGSRRRNAIAHLRAAVAATKAEQRAGTSLKEERKDDAYRGDLADVVRPRRPQAATSTERPARPSEARPAPLKLVAEQRVDIASEPVRPRRISVAEIAAEQPAPTAEIAQALEKAGSFAEYAENVGATKLPDLLEAAAAYLSFVEGMEQFSRPQLMTKVRQADPEEFSREDGLRSFGQLLRAGKIRKIKGGRFEVSDEIGYRPGEREAG
ncbi:hypothetical protein [Litorivita sp. NS0012-18]|uniref:hypothetical protein n=1 Tax=Litorivita sp. NS0012-18 TaxID=3127655 RepID=UPI003101D1B8